MPHKKTFLKQFLKDKKMVGSMRPSSRFLAEKMLKNIDFSKAKVLVELGPGTGVFTKEILARMAPDARLLVFELNDEFHKQLEQDFDDDRMYLIHDSAEHILRYLHDEGHLHADYVISSLPLTVFPNKLKQAIVQNSYNALKNNGKYIQFQYSLNAKRLLESTFQSTHISFTPLNFPPAFVYTCIKEK